MKLHLKKVGDLIYVPSETLLHQFGTARKLEHPVHLLITAANEDEPKHYRVSFSGSEWFLSRRDAYEPKGGREW
jgi:hypothetical protein